MRSLIIILILAPAILFSQSSNQKWIKIFEDSSQSILVDTSSLKQFENQISLLSITNYKIPITLRNIENISQIKTQILCNVTTKKFTMVGTLFYDNKFKILGEASRPGLSTSTTQFAESIESNKTVTEIFNWATSYLGITPEQEKINTTQPVAKIDQQPKSRTLPDTINGKGKSEIKIVTPVNSDKKESEIAKAPEKLVINNISESKVDKSEELKTSSSNQNKNNGKVPQPSSQTDVNVKDMIFYNGKDYSFQISAWRNKRKAESEVQKLKRRGHNAFLVQADLPNRGGTWYRVRIGFFTSIEATESYMKQIK